MNNINVKKFSSLFIISIFIFVFFSFNANSEATVNIQFVNHIQADLPEQDVFVRSSDYSQTKVVRVESPAALDPENLAKMAYATAIATPMILLN